MEQLSVDNLLGIKYIKRDDIDLIFNTADHFKEVLNRPIKKVPSLRDITIANLFFENSTRTKLSFELAEKRLSADVINFSSSSSSIKKGETLIDTVNNILAMKVDIIVIRHPNPGAALLLSKNVESCIVNAGDGTNEHPSQALLDAYSLKEKLGDLDGKKILILGDILHSRVALSNIYALKLLNAKIKICSPLSLVPKDIESLGVSIENNLDKALSWCDAVNVLRVQHERMEKSYFPNNREYSLLYGLDKKRINNLKKDILILHPGPINRGVEITSDIVESKNSIILDQVENGVAIRMAIIYLLASKMNISKES
ncbi:MAG TPA: aspartate carbamoyltransferase catalytic subunit [Flavobacteriaceae bacterium]|nr:aspartate carbamoyltransferase catalytic subunit [Flavobacteriaceae bacterium]|tara:strand:- start:950 stop:1891 length:942 start_codon:yes stop_codon:yes gene_type:complete